MAPFAPVTFKDGLIGDVLTSAVLPLLDLTYTLANLYHHTQSTTLIGRGWRRVSTAVMVAPMVWRFNQNLRGVKDSGSRWPGLANAGKYAAAAATALVGLHGKTKAWFAMAAAATCYQLMWDFFCDWRLPSR